ncbi:MAG: ATP-binding protein [Clostridiales bacterium]|jgi:hypothetical protein|nr:ATP-binding protein [Clostridiales bacterium]
MTNMLNFAARAAEGFALQLLIAEWLFSAGLVKRKYTPVLFVIYVVLFCVVYDTVVQFSAGMKLTQFIVDVGICLVVASSILFLRLGHAAGMKTIIFRVAGAYALQNMSISIYQIFQAVIGFQAGSYLSLLVTFLCVTASYTLCRLFFIRKLILQENLEINNLHLWISSFLILVMTTFIAPSVPAAAPGKDRLLYYFYAVAGDCLVLFVQFNLFNESKLQKQNEIMEHLLYSEKKQHELLKENIELINTKCHDLKHQVSMLHSKSGGKLQDDFILEIENSLQIYDSSVKTGNEALDIILMQKLLYCEQHKIKLTFIVNGKILNFLKPYDIYSIFGNALDNAIDSILQEDEEKRIISFRVEAKNKFLILNFENYFSGALLYDDSGLPVTTKADKKYHGFGMLSIRHIVEKYNGMLSIQNADNFFILNIIIPIP